MAQVTVLIPTVGRIRHLEQSLDALRLSTRLPDAVVVVAQGAQEGVAALAARFPELPLTVIGDDGRGRGRALNVGLRSIEGGVVLITDDDCRVRADWVERAHTEVLARTDTVVTGRVLAEGDLSRVPALKLDPLPHDYSGMAAFGKLAGGNMAARLEDLTSFGGFDEAMVPAGEDNDFCWRWLQSGRGVHYEPEMVIWHDDWRDDEQLRAVHHGYGQAQARLYAKHLRRGDVRIAPFLARDLWAGCQLTVGALAARRPLQGELNLAFFPGLLGALAHIPALMREPARSAPGGNDTTVRAGDPRPPRQSESAEEPRVAVVITTRNRRIQVLEAVASVVAQTVDTDILVMDDGSSDGTRDALLARFPSIRVETSPRSLGYITQRNNAIELVDTEFVVMMDDDAYFPSTRTLGQTLTEFDHPCVAVVTIPYVNARRDRIVRLKPPGSAGDYVAGVFVGVGAIFRRTSIRAVGGYEIDLASRGEEADLGLRLLAEGNVIRMARADPLVHWEASPSKDDSAFYYTARNEVLLSSLRVPQPYLGGRLIVVVAHALLRGLRKRRLGAVCRGVVAGCRSAWVRRRERRPVPVWAYRLTRTLRRRGPLPMEEVLSLFPSRASSA